MESDARQQPPTSVMTSAAAPVDAVIHALGVEGSQRLAEVCKQDARFANDLGKVLAGSRFVLQTIERYPGIFLQLLESGALQNTYSDCHYLASLGELVDDSADEAELMATLRQFRRREMVRIIFRDFSRRAQTMETTRDLSLLADACVRQALEHAHAATARRHGEPIGRDSGEVQRLVVLGMGKLGAFELNLSSDIDLIFAYPESGETDGDRSVSNQEFFTRVGQRLIKALDASTADGFVFRVDMRLRPYGDSGALVLSFAAMEEYYQDQGREWERYAMVKARVMTDDVAAADELRAMLTAFTYRRYIDFSVIEGLRSMKAMISREVRRRGLENDVKLGSGGIREIEFIVQSFQLIRGGRHTELQTPRLLTVLQLLREQQLLPEGATDTLREAYLFLRDTEHAIQGYADQQTQSLPTDQDGINRIAMLMGCADAAEFEQRLGAHRRTVSALFANVISAPDEDDPDASDSEWDDCWPPDEQPEAALAHLAGAGFEDPPASLQMLLNLHRSPRLATARSEGRERIDRLMPLLLADVARAGRPSLVIGRLMPLLEAVLRRSAYLVLLQENPAARAKLTQLCEASPRIAQDLARHPVLLDELIGNQRMDLLPGRAELEAELRTHLLRVPEDDLEGQMNALRYFKLAHSLRCAASEVTGALPLMHVSDYLSWLAEAILAQVMQLAWNDLLRKHGEPRDREGARQGLRFLVLAYGKLGGIELGHGSDLDLVFLHDADPMGETDGARAINNAVFFTRLGQRIIHILSTKTQLGELYEVDMRLRPSGDAGMLVPTVGSFEEYQRQRAWVWEHQALVRARAVCGDAEMATQFAVIRRDVLGAERDLEALRGEVAGMRAKMRAHLLDSETAGGKSPRFNLKQSPGGIVDIEFMVQYCALAWSGRVPALSEFTDNIRILEALKDSGLFPAQQASLLTDAYKSFRSASHRLALQEESGTLPSDEFQSQRDAVLAAWNQLIGRQQTDDLIPE